MNRSLSTNRKILNILLRKGKRKNTSPRFGYFILYAFLYKYLSDKLKNHLIDCIEGNETDLEMFYRTEEGIQDLREWALNDLGYFIESHSAYIDRFISDKFIEDIFSPEFFTILRDNIVFAPNNPAQDYFNRITEILKGEIRFYRFGFDEDLNSFMSNYLFTLSKFDIGEKNFTYAQVYDVIASSRQIRMSTTPEYISNLITSIVKSQKNIIGDAYDPFMKDGSILFKLYGDYPLSRVCGKEDNELYYYYSLIRAFIEDVDFTNISLYEENAIKSMAVDSRLFDVIASKVPNRFNDYSRLALKSQSIEIPHEGKSDFKEALLSNFDMDKLSDDDEALKALKVLEEKYYEIEKKQMVSFTGEYESLSDSEFLFLINMINSLRENGIMLVSLSQNFLFKSSLALLRKFLTYENNYIDAVISLPEELGRSVRPEVIILFRKDKRNDDIVFIDLSKKYGAVPSENAFPGLFKRNLILDDATTDKIIDAINNRRAVDKFSEIVSIRDLMKNDFNLAVSRYVDTYDGEFIRLKDLVNDKKMIDKEMDRLNTKINVLLDDLNIR